MTAGFHVVAKMPLLDFPPDVYLLRPGEAPIYGCFPELKKCVQWFISQLPSGEWRMRRDAVAKRFYPVAHRRSR
jgi:hypothetical protein